MLKTYSQSWRVERFGEPLAPNTEPVAGPTGREVIVRTRRCGICHTDLHLVDGYYDLGGGKKLQMADRGVNPPLTLGHEVVGELVAIGPDAASSGLQLGKTYLVYPWIGCGKCARCLKGQENLCVAPRSIGVQRGGGYGDTVLVPDTKYLLDIEGLEPGAAATLACAGLTAYGALKKAEADPSDWICVIGLGGLGTAGLLTARGLGYEKIAVLDRNADRRAWALANGAKVAIDARESDAAAQLRTATGGVMAVIDFVGSSGTAQTVTDVLVRGGTYVIVGLIGGDITIPLPSLPTRAITIRGSFTGTLAELTDLVGLAKSGRVPPNPVEVVAQNTINEALERLRTSQAKVRQVIGYD